MVLCALVARCPLERRVQSVPTVVDRPDGEAIRNGPAFVGRWLSVGTPVGSALARQDLRAVKLAGSRLGRVIRQGQR
jgi:hypothetical protein